MKVNYRDLMERVGWTFIQAFVGIMLAAMIKDGIEHIAWLTVLYSAVFAGAMAAGKVILAQQFGSRTSGDAFPGGVEGK